MDHLNLRKIDLSVVEDEEYQMTLKGVAEVVLKSKELDMAEGFQTNTQDLEEVVHRKDREVVEL